MWRGGSSTGLGRIGRSRRGTPPRSSRGKCSCCRRGAGEAGEAGELGRARATSRGPRPPPRWHPRRGAKRNRSTRSRRPLMRRTTICRSERAALLALVAGLLAGPAPVLVAQDTTQARPATSHPAPDTSQAAPGPTEIYQTIFDRRRTPSQEVRDELRAYANQPYRPLRRGEFYSAGFLTEQERLPYGRVLGNTETPAIPRLTERSSATTFDQIAIQAPRNASYHVGDSLLIVRVDRDITGWGGVVVPVGVARVTEPQRRQVLADVVMQFGRIHEGHLALPLEPFKDPGQVRPTPVDGGLEGTVIAQRDTHVLTGPQQVIFINRGRVDGVSPGDVFEAFKPASGMPGTSSEQVQVIVEIVHTRDHSSSGLILNIEHANLVPGMPVRLIRKMPS